MKDWLRKGAGLLSLVAAFGGATLFQPSDAAAQKKPANLKERMVGTWNLVSNASIGKDGTKTDLFGPNPIGTVILTSSGRFAIINMRSDLPKFASGNRMQGTADENKAIVHGSIAFFGEYSVSEPDHVLTLKVEGSTWPIWTGTDIKRVVAFDGDGMKWKLPAGPEVVWKRVD
jgi:hypothetical protein